MSFVSMPRQDLLLSIDSLAQEKQIDREVVFSSLEAAIAKIAKHKYGEEFDISASIDRRNGAIHVKRSFLVIDSADSVENYNPNTMLTVEQAKKYSKKPVVGDVVEDALPEPEFPARWQTDATGRFQRNEGRTYTNIRPSSRPTPPPSHQLPATPADLPLRCGTAVPSRWPAPPAVPTGSTQ